MNIRSREFFATEDCYSSHFFYLLGKTYFEKVANLKQNEFQRVVIVS